MQVTLKLMVFEPIFIKIRLLVSISTTSEEISKSRFLLKRWRRQRGKDKIKTYSKGHIRNKAVGNSGRKRMRNSRREYGMK